jgi:hypothetical protein
MICAISRSRDWVAGLPILVVLETASRASPEVEANSVSVTRRRSLKRAGPTGRPGGLLPPPAWPGQGLQIMLSPEAPAGAPEERSCSGQKAHCAARNDPSRPRVAHG